MASLVSLSVRMKVVKVETRINVFFRLQSSYQICQGPLQLVQSWSQWPLPVQPYDGLRRRLEPAYLAGQPRHSRGYVP